MFRKLLFVSFVLVVWIAPQAFAQWTCVSNCTSPTQIYPNSPTAFVGPGTSSTHPPNAIFHSRQGTNSNFELFDTYSGFGLHGVLIDSVQDDNGTLAPMIYNASMHVFNYGNVGIGTGANTPAGPIEINAASATTYNAGNPDEVTQIILANTNTTANNTAGLSFNASAGAGNQSAYIQSIFSRTNSSAALTFGTRNTSGTLGERVRITEAGNVGIGLTPASGNLLDVNGTIHAAGDITAAGSIYANYQDVAEWVPASESLAPGTVVVLNPDRRNEVAASSAAYDTSVAGVVSERPGILLGQADANKAQIATTGRVKVRVDARNAAIKVGDLLVTSDVSGTAMKSEPLVINGRRFHQPGTILGKALEPLPSGTGEILVLLSLQ